MGFRAATLLLALSLLVNGCAKKRAAIAPEDLENDRQALFDEIRRDSAANAETFVERIKLRVDESGGAPVVINILSLSGGGANGAFGAGLLRGWGTIKTGEFRRPKFDMVTGISTGAFISPFAIEGTDEAYVAIDEYYRNPTDT